MTQNHSHTKNSRKLNEICDFGVLSKSVLCPNEVQYFSKRDSKDKKEEPKDPKDRIVLKRKKSIEGNWKFNLPDSKILIVVVVNKKSGGQVGERFLNSFYRYLNPLQVVDLLDEGLEKLKVFASGSVRELRVVVGGGDGTIGSVASFLRSEVPEWAEKNPAIAPLPLGTGNDLSTSLPASIHKGNRPGDGLGRHFHDHRREDLPAAGRELGIQGAAGPLVDFLGSFAGMSELL